MSKVNANLKLFRKYELSLSAGEFTFGLHCMCIFYRVFEDLRHLNYLEAYDKSTVDWAQKNEDILQKVETERKIMDTVRSRQSTEEMARSHPETWLVTENNVRRTNTGEEVLRETKNNALGSVTEDGGRQYIYTNKDDDDDDEY